jgi:hypothetical protein
MFLALLDISKELVLPSMGYMGCVALFSRPELPAYFSNHLALMWSIVVLGAVYMPRIWFHRLFLTPDLGLEIGHVLNVYAVHVTYTLFTDTMDRTRYIAICGGCALLVYLYAEPNAFAYHVMLAWMAVDVIRSIYTLVSISMDGFKLEFTWPLLLLLGLPAYTHIYREQTFGMGSFVYLIFLAAIHDVMTTTSNPGKQDPAYLQPSTQLLTNRGEVQEALPALTQPPVQSITDFDWSVTIPQTASTPFD